MTDVRLKIDSFSSTTLCVNAVSAVDRSVHCTPVGLLYRNS